MAKNAGWFSGIIGGLQEGLKDKRETSDKALKRYEELMTNDNMEMVPGFEYKPGMTSVDVNRGFKQKQTTKKTSEHLDTMVAPGYVVDAESQVNPLVKRLKETSADGTITYGTIRRYHELYKSELDRGADKETLEKRIQADKDKEINSFINALAKNPDLLDERSKVIVNKIISPKGVVIKNMAVGAVPKLLQSLGLDNIEQGLQKLSESGINLGYVPGLASTDNQPQQPVQTPTNNNQPGINPGGLKPGKEAVYKAAKQVLQNNKLPIDEAKLIETVNSGVAEQSPAVQAILKQQSSQIASPGMTETGVGGIVKDLAQPMGSREGTLNTLATGGGSPTAQAPSVNPQDALASLSSLAQNYIKSLQNTRPSVLSIRNKNMVDKGL